MVAVALAVALALFQGGAASPVLASNYRMSFDNLTFGIISDGSLVFSDEQNLAGTLTVNPPLYGTGPITGTFDGRTMTLDGAGNGRFTGMLLDDGTLRGTYSYGSGSFAGQHGQWHAEPTSKPDTPFSLPWWLWFVVAALVAGAALALPRRRRQE